MGEHRLAGGKGGFQNGGNMPSSGVLRKDRLIKSILLSQSLGAMESEKVGVPGTWEMARSEYLLFLKRKQR